MGWRDSVVIAKDTRLVGISDETMEQQPVIDGTHQHTPLPDYGTSKESLPCINGDYDETFHFR